MSGLASGSNADLSKNEFNSGSSYSIHSKQASQSFNDLSRSQSGKARQTYASDYSKRLPSIVFSGKNLRILFIFKSIRLEKFNFNFRRFRGPNGVYNRRVGQYEYRGEIGIGKASGLRSLDSEYITSLV